jgi:DNA primase
LTPKHPAPGSIWEDEPQQKLTALRARLHASAQALRTPRDWAALLRTTALMPEQDFANTLLVSAQVPGAVMVRDYAQWAKAGRQVRRGEEGIETFAVPSHPDPRRPQDDREPGDDQPPPTWRDATGTAYVWDVSQTTGPPTTVPADPKPPGAAPAGLWDALCWLARRQGFAVEQEHGAPADGTVFWTARRIRVLPTLSSQEAVWALAHQLSHVLLHDQPGGHPPGTTTTGCTGLRKAEADSVAYVTCARYGITPVGELAYPEGWAGRDPRAQPTAAVLSAGHRITTAAGGIIRHTDRILRGDDPAPPVPATVPRPATAARPRPALLRADDPPDTAIARPTGTGPPAEPAVTKVTRRLLQFAQDFYCEQLAGSWAPAYLETRGISAAVAAEWHIGHAPAGWTELIDHLRRLPRVKDDDEETNVAGTGRPPRTGYSDEEIEATGLAKRSSRGNLIDVFRDRVVLPVHDPHGKVAGFIGRLHPESPDEPRYLNSPESASFKKGSLLFGLHQGRQALARGAVPVLVEGPFDAIAVSRADPGRHVGLAPCGTALTVRQAELISQAADLPRTGILACYDADTAGRKAAARAYGILRPHTPKLETARLNAKDPAKIFEQDGPQALRTILREDRDPLSAVLIDARIAEWDRYLDHIEGRYRAMHSTASLVAELLPEQAAAQVRRITGGRKLVMADNLARPVDNPELPRIAQILPAETAYQVTRTAWTLHFDVTEVLAAVANAVTDGANSPKGHAPRRDDRELARPATGPQAPRLAGTSFPVGVLPLPATAVRAASATGPRPQPGASRRSTRR